MKVYMNYADAVYSVLAMERQDCNMYMNGYANLTLIHFITY
jgi:hypothetical protein